LCAIFNNLCMMNIMVRVGVVEVDVGAALPYGSGFTTRIFLYIA
jgi:hypothetical protein